MSKEAEEPKDVTSNEEKELHRVYDYLCNFSPKHKLRKEMAPKLERKQKIMQVRGPSRPSLCSCVVAGTTELRLTPPLSVSCSTRRTPTQSESWMKLALS